MDDNSQRTVFNTKSWPGGDAPVFPLPQLFTLPLVHCQTYKCVNFLVDGFSGSLLELTSYLFIYACIYLTTMISIEN